MSSEPLPETRATPAVLAGSRRRDLLGGLRTQADLAQWVVPSLVGLTLASVRQGLASTMAATHPSLATLDAVQYSVGGPCVDAALADEVTLSGDGARGLFDEDRWVEFAKVGASHGVLSTMSMPVHVQGRVVGEVNLYAAAPHTFAGNVDRLATTLGAWARGAIMTADLPSTGQTARRAPRVLEETAVLHQAVGVVAAAQGLDREAAREVIVDAARRVGQDELQVARALIRPFTDRQGACT
jgi:GAF domain-containing protein